MFCGSWYSLSVFFTTHPDRSTALDLSLCGEYLWMYCSSVLASYPSRSHNFSKPTSATWRSHKIWNFIFVELKWTDLLPFKYFSEAYFSSCFLTSNMAGTATLLLFQTEMKQTDPKSAAQPFGCSWENRSLNLLKGLLNFNPCHFNSQFNLTLTIMILKVQKSRSFD